MLMVISESRQSHSDSATSGIVKVWGVGLKPEGPDKLRLWN